MDIKLSTDVLQPARESSKTLRDGGQARSQFIDFLKGHGHRSPPYARCGMYLTPSIRQGNAQLTPCGDSAVAVQFAHMAEVRR